MNLGLRSVAIVLAVVLEAAGPVKMFRAKESPLPSGFGWAQGFSSSTLIAITAILDGIGPVRTIALNIAPMLIAWAAVGLALATADAAAVHAGRTEMPRS
jgi:hypothetical protein